MIKHWLKILSTISAVAAMAVLFQNCGSDLNYADYNGSTTLSSVAGAPNITAFPSAQTLTVGQPLTLQVIATGSSLTYEWYKNGFRQPSLTGNVFAISSLTLADAGTYSVTVSNSSGSVSRSVYITVSPAATPTPTPTPIVAAPVITNPVAAVTATLFGTVFYTSTGFDTNPGYVSFGVSATGQNLTYQWYFINSSGVTTTLPATQSFYSFSMTSAAQAGTYRVVVTNSSGSRSSEATLTYTVFNLNF